MSMRLKEDEDKKQAEMSTALKNTMMHLIENGYQAGRGVYVYKGSASDIMTEISFFEGEYICILQRLDN